MDVVGGRRYEHHGADGNRDKRENAGGKQARGCILTERGRGLGFGKPGSDLVTSVKKGLM